MSCCWVFSGAAVAVGLGVAVFLGFFFNFARFSFAMRAVCLACSLRFSLSSPVPCLNSLMAMRFLFHFDGFGGGGCFVVACVRAVKVKLLLGSWCCLEETSQKAKLQGQKHRVG